MSICSRGAGRLRDNLRLHSAPGRLHDSRRRFGPAHTSLAAFELAGFVGGARIRENLQVITCQFMRASDCGSLLGVALEVGRQLLGTEVRPLLTSDAMNP